MKLTKKIDDKVVEPKNHNIILTIRTNDIKYINAIWEAMSDEEFIEAIRNGMKNNEIDIETHNGGEGKWID